MARFEEQITDGETWYWAYDDSDTEGRGGGTLGRFPSPGFGRTKEEAEKRLERNRREQIRWHRNDAALLRAVELVKNGEVYGILVYHDVPEGRAAKTKKYNTNFRDLGYEFGTTTDIGDYRSYHHHERWGPVAEAQATSEYEYLWYYDVPGYTSNRLWVLEQECKAKGIAFYSHYDLPQAKEKRFTGPDYGLVDRAAWREAGSPMGMEGHSWKWWTKRGMEFVDRICKLLGIGRPRFRGVSEKGFYLKWYVPNNVNHALFYAVCDKMCDDYGYPPVAKITISDCSSPSNREEGEHTKAWRERELREAPDGPFGTAYWAREDANRARAIRNEKSSATHYFVKLEYHA